MVTMANKVAEINLSDASGIDSPIGNMNAEISERLKTETLSDKILESKEATAKSFEETAADVSVGGACKAAGKIQSLYYYCITVCLLIFASDLMLTFLSLSWLTGRFR